MKTLLLTAALAAGFAFSSHAQTSAATSDAEAFQKGTFQGATADLAHYNAVYQLDSDDPKLIQQTLRNLSNDPRHQSLAHPLTASATALVEGRSRLQARLTAPLLDARGRITSGAALGPRRLAS